MRLLALALTSISLAAVAPLAGCARAAGSEPTEDPPSGAEADAGDGGVVACGAGQCGAGEYCCNASCGVCAAIGQSCSQQSCSQQTEGPPSCNTSLDCRTFSSYCGGCECKAVNTSDTDPLCSTQLVQCPSDPCGGYFAFCLGGKCVAAPPTQGGDQGGGSGGGSGGGGG